MRTTVNLDPSLLEGAKRQARQRRCTLSQVVDDALRSHLGQVPGERASVEIPSFEGTAGLRPGVDLDDRAALAELLGDDDRPGR
ncbi:MAG: hypothetical protein KDA97_09765 [Acidimicrobiales bacterium]|nr:hypothetical protein [Acidimicrobiales bacterium]